ncbi:hypothetical protein [Microtetraspora malaysiensis]|uniref:hypothetical protein n=1 Tax=Microtetraspora malaysiensis TaxID=161358 RepID=UPI003D8E6BF6
MGIDQVTLARLRRQYGDQEAGHAEAAINAIVGESGLEAATARRLQEFLWHTLPVKWLIDDPERVTVALGHLFTLAGLDRYASLATSARTKEILSTYAAQGSGAGREAYHAAMAESGLLPPDTPLLAWGVFTGVEENAARDACSVAIELAITAGELKVGARGWEKTRTAVTERCITAPQPGGSWLERVHAERLDTWTRPRNPRKAELCQAAVEQLRAPVSPLPDGFPLLRWLLVKAQEGLPLTDRHYIVPRLVTEAVETFGWRADLVGTLTREFDVFPLHSIRELATGEMKAIRRTGKQLVLTPLGRRLLADDHLLWDTATAAIIGRGHTFTLTAREIMLTLLTVHGPTPIGQLDQQMIDILGLEWNTPGGLAEPVRDERLALRHRLWALDCYRRERGFDAPFTLTPHGTVAVKAALRGYAVRPRMSLGLG